MRHQWIVYYDGYCNLCSRMVQWIIRNDRAGNFTFKPLQMPQTPELPDQGVGNGSSGGNTVILMMDDHVYERSTAALKIAARLRFPWPLMVIFFMVPRFIRDPIYNVVARNRKRWFGQRTSCFTP